MGGDTGIRHDTIIGSELMVQLVLEDYFGHKIMEWDKNVVTNTSFWRSILGHEPQFWPILALLRYHYRPKYCKPI